MRKIFHYILCFFVLGCFLWGAQDVFAAVRSAKYISNRIKIVRPETMALKHPAVTSKPSGKKALSPPLPGKEGAPAEEAATPEASSETTAALSKKELNEIFLGTRGNFFSRQGRVDPFEPFMRVPEAQVSQAEQKKLNIRPPQTPLERFDLSQLRLAAILMAPGRIRALVEENSGKGYIVSEGTYIGNKGGRVSKILKDRIVIEEKYLDVLGNVATRDIEMKLRQGED